MAKSYLTKTNFMNKVQLFYDDDLISLEQKINEWLSFHTEIKIVQTNLTSFGKPSQRAGIVTTEKHVFYILYETQQKEHASEAKAEQELMSSLKQMESDLGMRKAN